MLEWFEVENFKSIKKLKLNFSPLMVFVGPNAAGKTNIIQALSLFLDILNFGSTAPIDVYSYDQIVRRKKQPSRSGLRFALRCPYPINRMHGSPNPTTINAIIEVELVLKQEREFDSVHIIKELFKISIENQERFRFYFEEGKPAELVLDQREGGSQSTQSGESLHDLFDMQWLPKTYVQQHIEEYKKRDWTESDPTKPKYTEILTTFFSNRLADAFPSCTRLRLDATSLRRDVQVGISRYTQPFELAGEGLPLAIERLKRKGGSASKFNNVLNLMKVVYPGIENISTKHFQPGRVALSIKEKAIGDELGEGNISDGVIHALALLVALEDTPAKNVLAIEEPENALHPWALHTIIANAQERAARREPLLFTTHSPILVNAIKDPASLYIVENDPKLGTTVTSAIVKEHALAKILADSGQKLGDIWFDGTLGGVPGEPF